MIRQVPAPVDHLHQGYQQQRNRPAVVLGRLAQRCLAGKAEKEHGKPQNTQRIKCVVVWC